ncbi:MAG: ribonuclease R, partial [Alphaproteobacteria bacterium]|nr:ribonuclease R [Alphaproteobacteria bacterium]
MAKSTAPRSRRPSREALLEFIADNPNNSGKREIARSFGLKGDDRVWLRNILRDFVVEGLIEGGRSSRRGRPGLPPVMVLEITGVDNDGDLVGAPAAWKHDVPRPSVHLTGSSRALACAPGDRVLARIAKSGGAYQGKIMRVLPSPPSEILGVIEESGRELRLAPVNRRTRTEFIVDDPGDAAPGDVVVADLVPGKAYGPARVRVRTRVGPMTDARTLSLTAIHEHGLPDNFSDDALAEAKAAKVPDLGDRTDFRDVPFITIDPETARDFDDAVWAEPDTDNDGGWIVRVAIADAAHYVTPGSALDVEAKNRGNSAYFPDRVVPMLPEALSASLCSLEEAKDRACMVATLWLDASGQVTRHQFDRGLMRSVKRLTYGQVQDIHDNDKGGGDENIIGLVANLYGAHKVLAKARKAREPLEIVTAEINVVLGDDGHVERVETVAHIASHQLIEDLMIAANVAAAEVLTEAQAPCMYRVHDQPERERVVALAEFLDSLGLRLDKGQRPTPRMFNGVLRKAADTADAPAVHQATLRAQAKAEYSTHAAPHFGLNLTRYVHFTSPIRRYADVLVHRALISTLGLGSGGMAGTDGTGLEAIAQHISMTERRAIAAERDALARYLATFLADQIGAELPGRIAGVTKAGLFVTLTETGADGLVPMRTLEDDFYQWDEPRHRLIGERGHRVYTLGDSVTVGILEAVPATGGLLLEMKSGGKID